MTPHRGSRRTARLVLTPVTEAAVDELLDLHRDPGIATWYGGRWTPADARRSARWAAERWRADGVGRWLAHDARTGLLVGRGGPSVTGVVDEAAVEIGWAVRERLWGRGYATELGRAGIALAREILPGHAVVAFTERHNLRSRAVMERLGMRYDREIRRRGLVEGRTGVHDDAPFALYRT
ncbi:MULTISPECIES: GNAT family N-acetyltransferase [Pseudonocardia]|uniref:Acetyltransferase (GNAT) family protein n=2 Tax=Pseudonocardia TaxID=1847 RepID=A0A1Y2N0J4_PSEAH|nr:MULTISPECIES: GNAT family N-acetyltransferase [Pseudonocardia]OSY40617.1 Acetyltransferase (GNAT) family protein [Pseudonocardia autotrophica]TDN73585.1 RimJ/RimL family protein N-acetyltransferase [Pseudonocardia autotrophica]BBG04329.1 N-acetyltransferase [Pseudonocardia autotrophica]GEC25192.1 N-acetyltransferase [Pseudonocardia saturnea]